MAAFWQLGGPALPGDADAPPVRVRIVMRAPAAPEPKEEKESEPAEAKPEPIEQPPEEPETAEPTPEPVAPEPEIATAPKTEPREETPPQEESASSDALPVDAGEADPVADATPPQADRVERSEQQSPEQTVSPEAVPSIPAEPQPSAPAWSSAQPTPYPSRGQQQRRRLALDQGGSDETLDAVAAAVDWLARSQRPDGLWDARRWGAGKEHKIDDTDRGGAGGRAETGLTGLALLAMGGAGHSHLDGPYRDVVTRGLQALIDSQVRGGRSDGDLAGEASLFARTYCHSMATFALAEALAMTGDQRLRPSVERGIGFLVRGQNPTTGGWRYRPGSPGDRGDMSQLGWIVMALRSAELAGVAIPPRTWDGVERFIASVERGRHGGLACYKPREKTSVTMTAEALYCRQILGVANRRPAAVDEAVSLLTGQLPSGASSGRTPNLYYWYYATLALHHNRANGPRADDAWDLWNRSMQHALLPRQVASGMNAGSWSPNTLWGGYGGRVYSTALATMCLEVYYRYDAEQIGRDPWLAARETYTR